MQVMEEHIDGRKAGSVELTFALGRVTGALVAALQEVEHLVGNGREAHGVNPPFVWRSCRHCLTLDNPTGPC
jgi:hypothetical protein